MPTNSYCYKVLKFACVFHLEGYSSTLKWTFLQAVGSGSLWVPYSLQAKSGTTKQSGMWTIVKFSKTLQSKTCKC